MYNNYYNNHSHSHDRPMAIHVLAKLRFLTIIVIIIFCIGQFGAQSLMIVLKNHRK